MMNQNRGEEGGGDGMGRRWSFQGVEGWASVIECRRLHGDGFSSGGESGSYGLDGMEPTMRHVTWIGCM
jgi:hypothetical protein